MIKMEIKNTNMQITDIYYHCVYRVPLYIFFKFSSSYFYDLRFTYQILATNLTTEAFIKIYQENAQIRHHGKSPGGIDFQYRRQIL